MFKINKGKLLYGFLGNLEISLFTNCGDLEHEEQG